MTLIYVFTAIGLTLSGSSTVHIYTQKIHRKTQLTTFVGRFSGCTGLIDVSRDVYSSGAGVSNAHPLNCFDIFYQNVRGIMTKQYKL